MPKKSKKRKKSGNKKALASKKSKESVAKKRTRPAGARIDRKMQIRADLREKFAGDVESQGIRAELLYKVIQFFPLVTGSIVGNKALSIDINTFYLVFICLVLASGVSMLSRISGGLKLGSAILYVLSVVLGLIIFNLSSSIPCLLLLILSYVLSVTVDLLSLSKVKSLFSLLALQPLLMGCLALLGFTSQSGEIFWPIVMIGLVPGFLLSAAIFASRASELESAGWRRSFKTTNKKSEEVIRPDRLGQIYSLLAVLVPVIPVVGVPLGLVPESFLLMVIPFYWIPGLAQAFLQETKSDSEIAQRSIRLAAFATVLLCFASYYAIDGKLAGLFA